MVKRIFLAAILILVLISSASAIPANITSMDWGMKVSGGTSPTVVYNGTIWVKGMAFNATTASDTASLATSSGTTPVPFYHFNPARAGDCPANHATWGDTGVACKNLTVTMSAATDELMIYTAR